MEAISVPMKEVPCVEPVLIPDTFADELARVEIRRSMARLVFCVHEGEHKVIVNKVVTTIEDLKAMHRAIGDALRGLATLRSH